MTESLVLFFFFFLSGAIYLMVGWHHRLSGQQFEQTLGDSEGQRRSGLLQSMGPQRVRHNLAIEQQQFTSYICASVTVSRK